LDLVSSFPEEGMATVLRTEQWR